MEVVEGGQLSSLVTTRTVAHVAANRSQPHRYILSADHRHPMFQWSSFQCDGYEDDNARDIMTNTQIIVLITITLHNQDMLVCTLNALFLKVGP